MTGKPSDSNEGLPESLTERELEILVCLADGLSNQEIANKLYLAAQTVRWYNSQIYGKLGVSNRKEAIERAQALGLLSEEILVSAVTGKHNLPTQATPFVGRQHELVELSTLLKDEDTRLITVLAPGGMGKTRLALEAARQQIGRYADGVIFVPLAPLGHSNDIVTTIAENIGFNFYGENAPAQQLVDFLRDRSMLLVLDNFEHLMDGVQLIADMLQGVAQVRIITTSRERLNLRGETVYSLRELEFPTWETPEDALQYDAVKLFMQSAHRVRADFELQAHELDYLARICRLTAGMPLGIELAAGWVDVLSLEQIAAEIQKGIDILETEMHDVPERQRSIRATFDHTWERLTEDEKTVFMRLSIFRGGFTVAAAQAIANAGVRSLRQLANKALVQVSPDGRHDIHELLRQFGTEKLVASGEQTTIQAKHAVYFADFMQARRDAIFGHQQLETLDQIGVDFENIRSAWNVVVEQKAFDELSKFLDGLWYFLDISSRNQEIVELFEPTVNALQLLPTSDVTELALARLWARQAWGYNDLGLSEKAKFTAESAIRLLNRYDSPEDLLAAYRSLTLILMFRGEYEVEHRTAVAYYELARQLGNRSQEAHSLTLLCHAVRLLKDDAEAALHLIRQAKAIFEELGDEWGLMLSFLTEAGCEFHAGDYEKAKHWFTQSRVLAENFGSAFHVANNDVFLGIIAMQQGDYDQAKVLLRESLRIFWDAGYAHFAIEPLIRLFQLLLFKEKIESAVEVLAAINRHPEYHRNHIYYETAPVPLEGLREELKTKLGVDRFTAAWARGEKRELRAVVAELLAEFSGE